MYQPTINKTEFDWQKEYATKTTLLDESYFGPNDYIDSDNALIQQTATNIAASSNGVEEAVQKSLDYVYENVEYNAGESDEICFNAKASTVLESKTGQCDTQTMTVEGLLRAQGIATRRVGGCVWRSRSAECAAKFALQSVFSTAGLEVREPKFAPISQEDIDSGKISRAGYLHLWGEYYHPIQGWIGFESTAGKLVEGNCYTYNIELYPEDQELTCISKDKAYAQWCVLQN